MSSYSDIIFLVAASIVFSSLTINSARSFQTTSQNRYKSDLEFRALTMAQDEIDKVQWIYDQNELNPSSAAYIFRTFPKTEVVKYGSNEQYSEEFTVYASSKLIENSSLQNRYKVIVTVTNNTFLPEVTTTLSYIKTYGN